jgi:hypothetical protein
MSLVPKSRTLPHHIAPATNTDKRTITTLNRSMFTGDYSRPLVRLLGIATALHHMLNNSYDVNDFVLYASRTTSAKIGRDRAVSRPSGKDGFHGPVVDNWFRVSRHEVLHVHTYRLGC